MVAVWGGQREPGREREASRRGGFGVRSRGGPRLQVYAAGESIDGADEPRRSLIAVFTALPSRRNQSGGLETAELKAQGLRGVRKIWNAGEQVADGSGRDVTEEPCNAPPSPRAYEAARFEVRVPRAHGREEAAVGCDAPVRQETGPLKDIEVPLEAARADSARERGVLSEAAQQICEGDSGLRPNEVQDHVPHCVCPKSRHYGTLPADVAGRGLVRESVEDARARVCINTAVGS